MHYLIHRNIRTIYAFKLSNIFYYGSPKKILSAKMHPWLVMTTITHLISNHTKTAETCIALSKVQST